MIELTPQLLRSLNVIEAGLYGPLDALKEIADYLEQQHYASFESMARAAEGNAETCHKVFERLREIDQIVCKTIAMDWLVNGDLEI